MRLPPFVRAAPWATIGLIVSIFILDLLTPLGVAVWLFYLLPLTFTFWTAHRLSPFVLAAACTGLTVLGVFLSPTGVPVSLAILNRSFGVIVFWSVAWLLFRHEQYETKLERIRKQLAEGQRITHLGSWDYVAATQTTVWSNEEKHIYGLDPDQPSPDYETLLHLHIHPDDAPELDRSFRAALQHNAPFENENRIIRLDGTVRWIHNKAQPYFDAHGNLLRYIGTTLDITERKQAEERLKEEMGFSAGIIHRTPAIICGIAPDGTTTFINPAGEAITGYRAEELIGKNWWQVFYPGDEYRQVEQLFRDFEKGDVRDYEMTLTTRAGGKRVISWNSLLTRESNGKILHNIGFGNDVTERKLADLALRQSEELNRCTLQSLQAHIAVLDREGRIISTNQAWEEFAAQNGAACKSSATVGANYLDVCRHAATNDDSAAQALAGLEAVMTGRQEEFTLEYPCHSPQEQIWFYMTVVPLGERNKGGVVVSHLNITARKRAEEALFAEKERAQITLASIGDGVITTDAQGRIESMNPMAERLLGCSAQAACGQPFANTFRVVHESTRAALENPVAIALRTGETTSFGVPVLLLRGDGEELYIADSAAPIRGRDGRIVGAVTVFHDFES